MKYVITIVLTALVVGFGVYAYFQGWLPSVNFAKPQAVSVGNTEVSNPVSATPVPQAPSFTTVKAGGILSMKAYSVDVPNEWQYSTAGSSAGQIDKLTLTNGGYKIVITQAAMGGGGCVYPGDAQGPMGTEFTSFTNINSATGEKLRLSVSADGTAAVCEMQFSAWGDLTEFGHIDVTYPSGSVQEMIIKTTPIFSSIKKLASSGSSTNQAIIDGVKAALVAKRGSDFSSLNYSLSKVEGTYASGSVNGTGGGGMWFAANVNGTWQIVSDGNGVTQCSDLVPYPNFPKDMLPECWDTTTNKLVTR